MNPPCSQGCPQVPSEAFGRFQSSLGEDRSRYIWKYCRALSCVEEVPRAHELPDEK